MKNGQIGQTTQAWKRLQDQFGIICQRSPELSSSAFLFCAYLQMKSGDDASYSLKQAEKRLSSSQDQREFMELLQDQNFLNLVMKQEALGHKLSEMRQQER